ncbi:uncharacterized protein C8R40DRAFT_455904 [Lentinula edodes]|uniref:uncharacterized protein n=1 Tax=Lentinula edodes TaxID=5353 RepID=UPI001E8DC293|nr:uncharacterized protein C8R40DRAFT_455904 [Lentinula edodes]KAH7879963.1 hypothetical protein C8R40DRAFT_455904 [Lentinula edodes]
MFPTWLMSMLPSCQTMFGPRDVQCTPCSIMTRIDFDMGIMQTGLSVAVEKVELCGERSISSLRKMVFVFRRMKCVHTKDWSHWVRKP